MSGGTMRQTDYTTKLITATCSFFLSHKYFMKVITYNRHFAGMSLKKRASSRRVYGKVEIGSKGKEQICLSGIFQTGERREGNFIGKVLCIILRLYAYAFFDCSFVRPSKYFVYAIFLDSFLAYRFYFSLSRCLSNAMH